MKKKILIGISSIIVVIIALFSYVWLINPILFTCMIIEDEESWMLETSLESMDAIYNNNFDGKLPSDEYTDYRKVYIDIEVDYRSPINITGLEAVIEKVNSSEKDRIISVSNGTFIEGDTGPGHFVTREIGGVGFVIYVGDCKNEEEIYAIIRKLTNDCEIKMYYTMQWLGTRECSYTVKSKNLDIEYIDFTE